MADQLETRTKQRSPEHPSLNLEEALSRAHQLYDHESFNWTAADVAKRHWGYGPLSSSGLRTLAALIHYGLLEETGGGPKRRVRLTNSARSILIDRREDATERDAAIRKAALTPKLFEVLWAEWGPRLPSEANMEFDLIQKYKFNPVSVRAFIKDFKATVAYARLGEDAAEDKPIEPEQAAKPAEHTYPKQPEHAFPLRGNPSPQGTSMPQVQQDPGTSLPIDVTIPLLSGRRAILRIPASLSDIEYDLILDIVKDNMAKMKPIIVPTSTEGGPV